jgi:hypothetical protein
LPAHLVAYGAEPLERRVLLSSVIYDSPQPWPVPEEPVPQEVVQDKAAALGA